MVLTPPAAAVRSAVHAFALMANRDTGDRGPPGRQAPLDCPSDHKMMTRTCLTGRVHRTAALLVAVGIAGVIVVSGAPVASAATTASGSWP